MATKHDPPPSGQGKKCSSTIIPIDLRMVLVGKTGAGKSASGNNILGREEFEVDFSAQSVTRECDKSTGEKVMVIDTPGLFDTQLSESSIRTQLVECIALSSPGPHVFLLVVTIGRFTEEEQKAVSRVQDIFGEAALKHTMVLFTHGDKLRQKNIEDFIRQSGAVQHLIQQCGNRYHVFNNKRMEDREQVNQLLRKVTAMVAENGGRCYTNDMYQQVESAIQRREEELRQRYEHELREKENLESELERLMEQLELKDTDLREKQREIDDLQVRKKQTRKDKISLKDKRQKVREEAERDFDKRHIVGSLVAQVKLAKTSSCATQ